MDRYFSAFNAPIDGPDTGVVTRGASETLFTWIEDEGDGLAQDLCPTRLRTRRERRESRHDSPKAEARNGSPKAALSFDFPEMKQNL